MTLRQVAQRAWKQTKRIQDATFRRLRRSDKSASLQAARRGSRLQFLARLAQWGKKGDIRGAIFRYILASVPKFAPAINPRHPQASYWTERRKYERRIKSQWYKVVKYMGGAKSSSNSVEIFSDGSEAFSLMWSSIRSAKHRVWMQTYILKADNIGLRTIQELTRAARRGVQVAFIYDHFGSLGFNPLHFEELIALNGVVVCFNGVSELVHRFNVRSYVLFRSHRKILVVDNSYGFCGGMNISEEYCNADIGGNGRFRDTHAMIRGPGVVHLAEAFLETIATMRDLKTVSGDLLDRLNRVQSSLPVPKMHTNKYEWLDTIVNSEKSTHHTFLQVLTSDGSKNKRDIQTSLSNAIGMAQRRVYLTSPYFLPPLKISMAIIGAARRGVDVRILTAGKSDVPLINFASSHIYGLFLRNNVQIYELQSRELHAKTITSDGIIAMVGSYNLDHLSYKHNLEANLSMIDPKIAIRIEKNFFEDLKGAKKVVRRNWENRSFLAKVWDWLVYTALTFIME
ncbi:cardiolipin synthase-like [Schistocerca gregaria]|uniref:cardiolipin synthase-like n=1 Tax=Schistocerca gregaria TaxID=7010 RepID=UPI00211E0817|nr:cardiolipin synthase-like [Schistocerca gregaria]